MLLCFFLELNYQMRLKVSTLMHALNATFSVEFVNFICRETSGTRSNSSSGTYVETSPAYCGVTACKRFADDAKTTHQAMQDVLIISCVGYLWPAGALMIMNHTPVPFEGFQSPNHNLDRDNCID
jgi:hypothetical protein